MTWQIKHFDDLTRDEVYDALELRCHVFIVEQTCPYPDIDGKDRDAYHYLAYESDTLVAYARILKPGVTYKEASIGRVVTRDNVRKSGLGRHMMERSIAFARETMQVADLRISAQAYLLDFYESLGFVPVSEPYLEDDIPHMEMYMTLD